MSRPARCTYCRRATLQPEHLDLPAHATEGLCLRLQGPECRSVGKQYLREHVEAIEDFLAAVLAAEDEDVPAPPRGTRP